MKILYDHQMFSMQKYGGVTRYFCNLMQNLPQNMEYELPIVYSENHYLKEMIGLELKQISLISSFRIKRRVYYFFNDRVSCKHIKKGEFDLFHPSYYSTYFLKSIKKPFVLTVHDMIHEKFHDLFSPYDKTTEYKKNLINKAEHVIAVSQCTKNDIVDLFDINPDKISVVHHGYESFATPVDRLFDSYILYVGDRKNYKNFNFFIKSVAPLLAQNRELKIVCTGMPFSKEELLLFSEEKIQNQLIQLSVNDRQLASLYKYALLFVYPSLYEGFGIPILEAFKNKCPVCLSDASCFPEVAGEAACYFDPYDSDSILDAVSKVINDEEYADTLRNRGEMKVEEYSIKKMVDSTCDIYYKCV